MCGKVAKKILGIKKPETPKVQSAAEMQRQRDLLAAAEQEKLRQQMAKATNRRTLNRPVREQDTGSRL